MTLAVQVSRTELELDLLALEHAPNGYHIDPNGFGPGGMTWRRQFATSPVVHGRALLSAVMETKFLTLEFHVFADEEIGVAERIAEVVAAFSQFSYTLTIRDGTGEDQAVYSYTCEPADVSVGSGGLFNSAEIKAFTTKITAIIPASPIPVEAPI